MKKKWRIIFYNALHPIEPRCYAETQFTRKRINIWMKHKRYSKKETIIALVHESVHIIFHQILGENYKRKFDYVVDWVDYQISKRINQKAIIKEKGWNYFQISRMCGTRGCCNRSTHRDITICE